MKMTLGGINHKTEITKKQKTKQKHPSELDNSKTIPNEAQIEKDPKT